MRLRRLLPIPIISLFSISTIYADTVDSLQNAFEMMQVFSYLATDADPAVKNGIAVVLLVVLFYQLIHHILTDLTKLIKNEKAARGISISASLFASLAMPTFLSNENITETIGGTIISLVLMFLATYVFIVKIAEWTKGMSHPRRNATWAIGYIIYFFLIDGILLWLAPESSNSLAQGGFIKEAIMPFLSLGFVVALIVLMTSVVSGLFGGGFSGSGGFGRKTIQERIDNNPTLKEKEPELTNVLDSINAIDKYITDAFKALKKAKKAGAPQELKALKETVTRDIEGIKQAIQTIQNEDQNITTRDIKKSQGALGRREGNRLQNYFSNTTKNSVELINALNKVEENLNLMDLEIQNLENFRVKLQSDPNNKENITGFKNSNSEIRNHVKQVDTYLRAFFQKTLGKALEFNSKYLMELIEIETNAEKITQLVQRRPTGDPSIDNEAIKDAWGTYFLKEEEYAQNGHDAQDKLRPVTEGFEHYFNLLERFAKEINYSSIPETNSTKQLIRNTLSQAKLSEKYPQLVSSKIYKETIDSFFIEKFDPTKIHNFKTVENVFEYIKALLNQQNINPTGIPTQPTGEQPSPQPQRTEAQNNVNPVTTAQAGAANAELPTNVGVITDPNAVSTEGDANQPAQMGVGGQTTQDPNPNNNNEVSRSSVAAEYNALNKEVEDIRDSEDIKRNPDKVTEKLPDLKSRIQQFEKNINDLEAKGEDINKAAITTFKGNLGSLNERISEIESEVNRAKGSSGSDGP